MLSPRAEHRITCRCGRLGGLPGWSATAQPQCFITTLMVTVALLHAPSFCCEEVVSERERRLRHLLLVLGSRAADYWLARCPPAATQTHRNFVLFLVFWGGGGSLCECVSVCV